jgi:phosphoserine phosphatase RsbU/P
MADLAPIDGTGLEVVSPNGSRRYIHITAYPYFVGRGFETGNHLQLDDPRISRECLTIFRDGDRYCLKDRGHRYGIFVNGKKMDRCVLEDGDVISFGIDDSYEIIFRAPDADTTIQTWLDEFDGIANSDAAPSRLRKLNLLLEATALLHSQLPVDTVLGTMLDHAIAITDADRGLLLQADASGSLPVRLARGAGGTRLSPERLIPSQTALRLALERQTSVITEDLTFSDIDFANAESVREQQLRAIVAIPLYSVPRASSDATSIIKSGLFLGVLYLDSRRPAAFSKLDRQIINALATEAASILDNARLVDRDRERQRLEQELNIARDIQQALLPNRFRHFPDLTVTGFNSPCLAVGGDYFDVFPISDERTAFLIADVSGKGLGAALLTTMLQGALTGMTDGVDPASVFFLINRFLCEHAEVARYATIFFGILDRHGRLDFINAGHPLPILLRGADVSEPFIQGACPVGLLPDTHYATSRGELNPGDTLILYSDGVTEAMDPDEQMYGVSRLRGVLAGQQAATLERIEKTILESVRKFTRGASQRDDITLLLIRYRGAAQGTAP